MKLKIIIVRNLDSRCKSTSDRLADFTIFCIQQYCPYQLVNDVSEAVFPQDCEYVLFIKAGHLFWDTSIFEKCIAQSSVASGDTNWLLINVKQLEGRAADSLTPTPFDDTVNSMKYYSYPEEMSTHIEALMNNLKAEVPSRLQPFAQQLNYATDNLSVGYYVINTEAIADHTPGNYNTYIGVCGGLKSVVLLGRDSFGTDTKVLMFDISPAAIEWQRHLREHWNGDSNSFLECHKTFKERFPDYMPINGSSIQEFMKQNNMDDSDLQDAWNKYKKLDVVFDTLDIFNKEHKGKMTKFSNGNTYFWISNCFIMERIIFQKGFDQAARAQTDWIKDFKLRSSGNCTFDIGKRLF
tara:strand:- start:931 stop:1986 length:1056 start_codon:yes stop_codon:yes gene_type:complete